MAKLIGLTGGIASGKSAVAQMLVKLGARHIDADEVAREVVQPGTPGLSKIVEVFGPDVLTEDGALSRERMRKLVFDDPAMRRRLEAITHPLIGMRIAETIQEMAMKSGHPIVIEAALLVETGDLIPFDALVVVDAPEETQLRRLKQRDGIEPADGRKILEAQMPAEERNARADYVIENGGSLEETRRQVRSVWNRINRS